MMHDSDAQELEDIESINDLRAVEDNRVRFSRLKLISRSPAHYLSYQDRGTQAKDKGTAVHAILSGQSVTCYDKKTDTGRSAPRRGKDWEAFKAANDNKIILSASEYDDVCGMVDAVRKCREADEPLNGTPEETLSFSLMGLPFRSTPDVRGVSHWTEIKTCQSSAPGRFAWQAFKMGYHAQMWLHGFGCRQVYGKGYDTGYVVAVESTKPYPVVVYKLKPNALELGEKMVRLWTETLKGCIASGQFPGYAQSVMDLDVPEQEIEIGEAYSGDSLPEGW